MASIDVVSNSADLITWNEAHDRLQKFLQTFDIADHSQVSRLTLKILDRAQELHLEDSSRHPTTLTMEEAHRLLTEWLAGNLDVQREFPSQIFTEGCMALLLSEIPRTAPETFLLSPLSDDVRQHLHRMLLVTGPDLRISTMTPRHFDYGPILHLARKTWHLWNTKEILIALLFWSGVYFVFYWWLSDIL